MKDRKLIYILGGTSGDCRAEIEEVDRKLSELQAQVIEKPEVFPEMMRFTMKAGMVTEVKM